MTTTPDPLHEGLAALSRFFIGGSTLQETLHQVAELSVGALGADMAGITMLVEGRPATAVFTDAAAPEIDRHQYETGRGPCLEAFHNQRIVRIDSIADDDRYPDFSESAGRFGITQTLSLPLVGPDEPLGALNVYFRGDGGLPPEDEAPPVGTALAEQVSIVLANARAYQDAAALADNLKQALGSRAVIDQAIGILMSTGGRTPAQTFEMLARASQRENRRLRDIAAEIVETAQRRGPPGSTPTAD